MNKFKFLSPAGWGIVAFAAILMAGFTIGEPSGSAASVAAPAGPSDGTAAHPAKPVVMKYSTDDDRCVIPAGPAGIKFVECPAHLR